MKRALLAATLLLLVVLATGSFRQPHFWFTADQQGDRLLHAKRYAEAAKTYADPWRAGVAQYRNGDFKEAAKTFARVPGAIGAYNQGNANLMHGAYSAAMASYDRALGFKPGWKEALDNKAVAQARQAQLDASGKDRDQEATDAYTPDEIAFDQKGGDTKDKELELGTQEVSDQDLRALWLRQVTTTPGDFLRAKFSYQAARDEAPPSAGKGEAR